MPVLLVGVALALLLHFAHLPDETVVLLPGPDGKVGVVVVQRGAQRMVLDEPYAASCTGSGATVRMEEGDVQREFGPVLAALPPRPVAVVLYFVTGEDELTDSSKEDLRRLLDELRTRPQSDIVLIGHTDRVGKDAANDALSLQRAERVKAELLNFGIAAERVRVAGRGEREPLVSTEDGIEQPRNRRVEVNVR